MTDPILPVFYGVWIPGEGWLNNFDKAYASERKEVAEQVANCIGRGAIVRYLDSSIRDFETMYLAAEAAEAERAKTVSLPKDEAWHTFKNLKRLLNSFAGK